MAFGLIVAIVATVALIALLASRRTTTPKPSDAVWSAAADRLRSNGSCLPGQLSVTTDTVEWMPSRHAAKRGAQLLSVPIQEAQASLQRGVGLRDVILTTSRDGISYRFVTRDAKGLRDALARADADPQARSEP